MDKYILLSILFFMLLTPAYVFAEEKQEIENESSGVSVNLNSQIKEDGQIEKQGIKNIHSWCNININRNTYKFYNISKDDIEKTNFRDRI